MFNSIKRNLKCVGNRMITTQLTPNQNTVYVYKCLEPNVPYSLALKWMKDLHSLKTKVEDPELRDIIFIVQHNPVYTLGKAATEDNVMFPLDETCPFEVHRIERGGEVTYHGPGQLTIYPILNLKNYKKDLHWYVAQLESLVIDVLKKYNIQAETDPKNPGVWIGDSKIAALGCKFNRWVTLHGFAVNVNLESLDGFKRIVPCGIQGKNVVTMQEYDQNVNIDNVANDITESFGKIFNCNVIESEMINDFYDRDLEHYLLNKKH